MRKIIHCDMDAFYASVAQRDHPELRGKPVIVGGNPKSRGVVATASYEARKFGVRSAMSCAQAQRRCPSAIFVRPDFQRYEEVSQQIREIFKSITPLVEPLSLDEAYLDVTENSLQEPIARNVAVYIKKQIFLKTQLTASAGVGPNKFIAKIASELHKPNGLTVISPPQVERFLEFLPVEKLWGVGPATAKRLHELHLKTAGDIRKLSPDSLEKELGKFGIFLHGLSNGIDTRPVVSEFEPKSRGTETTFEKDILNPDLLSDILRGQSIELETTLKEAERLAKTLTLKIKYSDFTTITRSKTLLSPVTTADQIYSHANWLLHQNTEVGMRPIRLLGLSVSGLIQLNEPIQLSFEW